MTIQTRALPNLPDTDPAKATVPIRRLVLVAFVCAVLAVVMLVLSSWHVMETTDALSMSEERARAAEIADILGGLDAAEATARLDGLAAVSGLRNLALAARPADGEHAQSMPLLSGALGGQFLTWTAARPGLTLFRSFAPTRVPLMSLLIVSALGCLLAMLRHVRRIEAQRRLAQRQALRDHLTGLPNRRALKLELTRLSAQPCPFSVLALDLDRFKPINDLFGHHAGDLALIEVARRLSDQLRPGEILARIGGDEFVAIVHREAARGALVALARDCIAAIAGPLQSVGPNVIVEVSLGIVENGHGQPAEDLLKRADRALYEAKRLNGGAFCFAGEGNGRQGRDSDSAGDPQRLLARG